MKHFVCTYTLALRRQLRSRGSWVVCLALLAMLLLALVPARQDAVVRVGLVLPEEGGRDLEELLLRRSSELVRFIPTDEATMERRILSGSWDCGLVLAEDFDARLARLDTDQILTMKIGPASSVYPLVRETVAGCMMELLSPHIARHYLAGNRMEGAMLEQTLEELRHSTQRVQVRLQTLDGDPAQPLDLTRASLRQVLQGLLGVVTVLWGLLLAVDMGNWLRTGAALRLLALRPRWQLLLPRLCAGLTVPAALGLVLAVLLGGASAAASFLALTVLTLGISLAAARFRVLWQAVPALLPFLAVGALLLEPVLLDVSALLPGLAPWTGFLPVTLYISGCGGNWGAVAALLAEAAMAFALATAQKKTP